MIKNINLKNRLVLVLFSICFPKTLAPLPQHPNLSSSLHDQQPLPLIFFKTCTRLKSHHHPDHPKVILLIGENKTPTSDDYPTSATWLLCRTNNAESSSPLPKSDSSTKYTIACVANAVYTAWDICADPEVKEILKATLLIACPEAGLGAIVLDKVIAGYNRMEKIKDVEETLDHFGKKLSSPASTAQVGDVVQINEIGMQLDAFRQANKDEFAKLQTSILNYAQANKGLNVPPAEHLKKLQEIMQDYSAKANEELIAKIDNVQAAVSEFREIVRGDIREVKNDTAEINAMMKKFLAQQEAFAGKEQAFLETQKAYERKIQKLERGTKKLKSKIHKYIQNEKRQNLTIKALTAENKKLLQNASLNDRQTIERSKACEDHFAVADINVDDTL